MCVHASLGGGLFWRDGDLCMVCGVEGRGKVSVRTAVGSVWGGLFQVACTERSVCCPAWERAELEGVGGA